MPKRKSYPPESVTACAVSFIPILPPSSAMPSAMRSAASVRYFSHETGTSAGSSSPLSQAANSVTARHSTSSAATASDTTLLLSVRILRISQSVNSACLSHRNDGTNRLLCRYCLLKRQLISSPHGTLDAALIVPPMPSTIAFAMESPSPVPGMSFALSAR